MFGGDLIKKHEKEILQSYLDSEKAATKELEKAYQQALKDIDTRIAALMGRDDADLQNVIYRIEYQRNLRLQVQSALERLQVKEFESISNYLSESYTDGFVSTAYSFHQQGVPLIIPIDPEQVAQAVVLDSKISEGLYNRLGVETAALKKSISGEISRGIAAGMAYSEIARNISNATKAPLARTKTIVRTESHRIQEAARLDAMRKAKTKGADSVKMWNSTLDGDTRPTHRHLDGQIREVEEPFEMDGKSAMHPGGFGDPAEDCNCRCHCLQRTRWLLDDEELQILKNRAEFFGLDKTKDLEEFKEKYLKASKTLDNSGKNGIIKETEMLKKDDDARKDFKFISDERFNSLTIEAAKKGAIILRGSPEIEQHLDNMGASASTIGDALLFRTNVCVSEVLEETFHYTQNLAGTNDDKGEPLRTILNEIEAKEYVLANANKYKVPRNELELIEKQLAGYKKQLADYEKGGD